MWGEWAWLRLQQRSALGITPAAKSKLSPRYYGPFKVVERIGQVSYKLQLPAKARILDVFNVLLLKKFQGVPPVEIVPLPDLLHGRVIPTPEKVVRARLNRGIWELLVPWAGCSAADASWEKMTEFVPQSPKFCEQP